MQIDRRWAIDAIVDTARALHSVDAPRALADELITLKQDADRWHELYEREKWARIQAERNQSAGFMRRIGHPSLPRKPVLDAITDDWIETGRED